MRVVTRNKLLSGVLVILSTLWIAQQLFANQLISKNQPTRDTLYTKWNFTIARVLGPGLPPLESPSQTSINLEFILRRENIYGAVSGLVRSFWVVQCMIDQDERGKIIKLLKEYKQEYFEMKNCTTDKTLMLEQYLNVNAMRNLAIQEGFSRPTNWMLTLDGMIFLTHDSLRRIQDSLHYADKKNSNIALIPYFRLISCQRNLDHTTDVKFFQKHRQYLSFHQESQIALSRNNMKGKFYDENHSYGKDDKMTLVKTLSTDKNISARCSGATVNSLLSIQEESDDSLMLDCGYMIRLRYWPENWMDSECADKKPTVWEMKKMPELNMRLRGSLRDKSRKRLESSILNISTLK